MDEAYIPDDNILGEVGSGWAVAITTLMNERAGLAFAAQAALQLAMRRAIDMASDTPHNGGKASEDPVVRDRLTQLFIESEIFRITNLRGLTKIMKNGVPGPEGSLGKWQWAEVNQHLMELAMEIRGPYSQFADRSDYSLGGDWQYQYLRTRANSIEGGTTDILRNIVAERVLGLPKGR
jgi:alkylation response protein AidB-like acyl-CoA dehydrogenase